VDERYFSALGWSSLDLWGRPLIAGQVIANQVEKACDVGEMDGSVRISVVLGQFLVELLRNHDPLRSRIQQLRAHRLSLIQALDSSKPVADPPKGDYEDGGDEEEDGQHSADVSEQVEDAVQVNSLD